MKVIIILLLNIAFFTKVFSQKDIYQLVFKGLNKQEILMSALISKKIVISAFNASNPDKEQLKSLEKLYQLNKASLNIIVIPISDELSNKNYDAIKKLWLDTLKINFIITDISKVDKNSGDNQHKLMRWVTSKNYNNHFDNDITKQGEVFVISEKGVLFARFNEKVDLDGFIMQKIIKQIAPDN